MGKTFIFLPAIENELLSKNDLKNRVYLKIVNVDEELFSSMFCGSSYHYRFKGYKPVK